MILLFLIWVNVTLVDRNQKEKFWRLFWAKRRPHQKDQNRQTHRPRHLHPHRFQSYHLDYVDMQLTKLNKISYRQDFFTWNLVTFMPFDAIGFDQRKYCLQKAQISPKKSVI